MNKKKKRNRIILCICSILVVFASIFAVIPFNKETKKVYADESQLNFTFHGSPLYTKLTMRDSDLNFLSTTYDITLSYNFSTDYNGIINRIGLTLTNFAGGLASHSFDISSSSDFGTLSFVIGSYTYYFQYQFSNQSAMSVPIGFDYFSLTNAYGETTTAVSYFDSDEDFLMISNTFIGASSDYYELPRRRYYFETALNLQTNEYYELGYREGFRDGEESGSEFSYNEGYLIGKNKGYWDGYEQALENDDRYNFTNLIASVIDVPVRTFTSLFNFEILGVNLSGFFLGLLTCCIVIGVVRLIL